MKHLKTLSFTSFIVVVAVMVTATIVEKIDGTEYVHRAIYGSWWFALLWALLAVTGFVYILKRKLFRRPATFMLHLSLLLILAGALVTHIWGTNGTLELSSGQSVSAYLNSETDMVEELPFSVTLDKFHVQYYPGTQSAMDYVSTISFSREGAAPQSANVSMNHVGKYSGYRFYQSGYSEDGQTTYLMVTHDPWGISISYVGYFLLFLSMLLVMVMPNEGFRMQLKRWGKVAVLFLGCLIAPSFQSALSAAPKVLPRDVAADFGNLYTYYNGRICPVQTVARDFTIKLYGSPKYKGYTAEQVLTGWVLFATNWIDEPMIKVKGAQLAEYTGKSDKYISYTDLLGYDGYKLETVIADIHAGKKVANSRAIIEADEKMNILLMLFNGQMLRIYPYAHEEHGQTNIQWFSQGSNPPVEVGEERWFFIKKSMDYIGELAASGQYDELRKVLSQIRKYQTKEVGAALPSDSLFRAEMLYNRLSSFTILSFLMLTLGLIVFVFSLRAWLKGTPLPRYADAGFFVLVCLSALYVLLLSILRAVVSGHLPLSNGYETMQFMALSAMVITLLLWRRFQLIPPFGIFISGLALLVSRLGESNPQITPLMPVLASPLLSLHVCVIMIAYSLFAFTMLNALLALPLSMKSGRESYVVQLTNMSRLLLFPAIFLLTLGIFIGAIWANQSWGRYWGWDPKEVWALITMMIYAIPMHSASFPQFQRPRFYHTYMLLAFLTILMTYFGVNFFLGGMHSYA